MNDDTSPYDSSLDAILTTIQNTTTVGESDHRYEALSAVITKLSGMTENLPSSTQQMLSTSILATCSDPSGDVAMLAMTSLPLILPLLSIENIHAILFQLGGLLCNPSATVLINYKDRSGSRSKGSLHDAYVTSVNVVLSHLLQNEPSAHAGHKDVLIRLANGWLTTLQPRHKHVNIELDENTQKSLLTIQTSIYTLLPTVLLPFASLLRDQELSVPDQVRMDALLLHILSPHKALADAAVASYGAQVLLCPVQNQSHHVKGLLDLITKLQEYSNSISTVSSMGSSPHQTSPTSYQELFPALKQFSDVPAEPVSYEISRRFMSLLLQALSSCLRTVPVRTLAPLYEMCVEVLLDTLPHAVATSDCVLPAHGLQTELDGSSFPLDSMAHSPNKQAIATMNFQVGELSADQAGCIQTALLSIHHIILYHLLAVDPSSIPFAVQARPPTASLGAIHTAAADKSTWSDHNSTIVPDFPPSLVRCFQPLVNATFLDPMYHYPMDASSMTTISSRDEMTANSSSPHHIIDEWADSDDDDANGDNMTPSPALLSTSQDIPSASVSVYLTHTDLSMYDLYSDQSFGYATTDTATATDLDFMEFDGDDHQENGTLCNPPLHHQGSEWDHDGVHTSQTISTPKQGHINRVETLVGDYSSAVRVTATRILSSLLLAALTTIENYVLPPGLTSAEERDDCQSLVLSPRAPLSIVLQQLPGLLTAAVFNTRDHDPDVLNHTTCLLAVLVMAPLYTLTCISKQHSSAQSILDAVNRITSLDLQGGGSGNASSPSQLQPAASPSGDRDTAIGLRCLASSGHFITIINDIIEAMMGDMSTGITATMSYGVIASLQRHYARSSNPVMLMADNDKKLGTSHSLFDRIGHFLEAVTAAPKHPDFIQPVNNSTIDTQTYTVRSTSLTKSDFHSLVQYQPRWLYMQPSQDSSNRAGRDMMDDHDHSTHSPSSYSQENNTMIIDGQFLVAYYQQLFCTDKVIDAICTLDHNTATISHAQRIISSLTTVTLLTTSLPLNSEASRTSSVTLLHPNNTFLVSGNHAGLVEKDDKLQEALQQLHEYRTRWSGAILEVILGALCHTLNTSKTRSSGHQLYSSIPSTFTALPASVSTLPTIVSSLCWRDLTPLHSLLSQYIMLLLDNTLRMGERDVAHLADMLRVTLSLFFLSESDTHSYQNHIQPIIAKLCQALNPSASQMPPSHHLVTFQLSIITLSHSIVVSPQYIEMAHHPFWNLVWVPIFESIYRLVTLYSFSALPARDQAVLSLEGSTDDSPLHQSDHGDGKQDDSSHPSSRNTNSSDATTILNSIFSMFTALTRLMLGNLSRTTPPSRLNHNQNDAAHHGAQCQRIVFESLHGHIVNSPHETGSDTECDGLLMDSTPLTSPPSLFHALDMIISGAITPSLRLPALHMLIACLIPLHQGAQQMAISDARPGQTSTAWNPFASEQPLCSLVWRVIARVLPHDKTPPFASPHNTVTEEEMFSGAMTLLAMMRSKDVCGPHLDEMKSITADSLWQMIETSFVHTVWVHRLADVVSRIHCQTMHASSSPNEAVDHLLSRYTLEYVLNITQRPQKSGIPHGTTPSALPSLATYHSIASIAVHRFNLLVETSPSHLVSIFLTKLQDCYKRWKTQSCGSQELTYCHPIFLLMALVTQTVKQKDHGCCPEAALFGGVTELSQDDGKPHSSMWTSSSLMSLLSQLFTSFDQHDRRPGSITEIAHQGIQALVEALCLVDITVDSDWTATILTTIAGTNPVYLFPALNTSTTGPHTQPVGSAAVSQHHDPSMADVHAPMDDASYSPAFLRLIFEAFSTACSHQSANIVSYRSENTSAGPSSLQSILTTVRTKIAQVQTLLPSTANTDLMYSALQPLDKIMASLLCQLPDADIRDVMTDAYNEQQYLLIIAMMRGLVPASVLLQQMLFTDIQQRGSSLSVDLLVPPTASSTVLIPSTVTRIITLYRIICDPLYVADTTTTSSSTPTILQLSVKQGFIIPIARLIRIDSQFISFFRSVYPTHKLRQEVILSILCECRVRRDKVTKLNIGQTPTYYDDALPLRLASLDCMRELVEWGHLSDCPLTVTLSSIAYAFNDYDVVHCDRVRNVSIDIIRILISRVAAKRRVQPQHGSDPGRSTAHSLSRVNPSTGETDSVVNTLFLLLSNHVVASEAKQLLMAIYRFDAKNDLLTEVTHLLADLYFVVSHIFHQEVWHKVPLPPTEQASDNIIALYHNTLLASAKTAKILKEYL